MEQTERKREREREGGGEEEEERAIGVKEQGGREGAAATEEGGRGDTPT